MALKASVFSKKTPPRMQNLVRYELDDQRRFPLKVVNVLSQEFSSHGLQFFKRKKSVTHVSVSRPHHLNLDQTPVSDSIRDIVTFVVENQDCTRRMILDKFVPEPDKPESAEAPPEGDAPEPEHAAFPRAHRRAQRPALARAPGPRGRVRQRPNGDRPQSRSRSSRKRKNRSRTKNPRPNP